MSIAPQTAPRPEAAAAPAAASRQLDLVQALRGLAAFGVVTHHVAVGIDTYFGDSYTPPGFGLGWVGVDLFFVLSGFIMVWTTQTSGQGLRTAASFWMRRAVRVYPPYWAATLMALALTAALPSLIAHMGKASLVSSFLLWPEQGAPYLNPGWTLIYELWFYLGFGFLLLAPRRLLPMLLAAWALAVIAGALTFGMHTAPILHLVINPLTLNFLMGAAVALIVMGTPKMPRRPVVLAVAATGALGMLIGAYFITETGWNEWTRMIGCGPAAAVLLAGTAFADRQGFFKPPKALVTLGDWSYALYLVHQPLVFFASILCLKAFGVGLTGVLAATVTGLILPFPAAWLLHTLVEKPAQSLGRKAAKQIEQAP
jgi:peptidoglycan/LPS O-acetylase OafA/YrhL